MNEHVGDLLPFYVNQTLPQENREAIEAHLQACPQCQLALREWEDLAVFFRSTAPPLRRFGQADSPVEDELPALSPVVRANLRKKPSLPEAILSTASLIGAQRIYFKEIWLIQTVSLVLLISTLATLFLPFGSRHWDALPFFILVPLLAVLGISFLENQENELDYEILAVTPTHPGVLIFARLTLALGIIAGLALLGSLLISGFNSVPLAWLVMTWLGPMLWLSALTTLLALLWNPWIAAGISLTLWGGILLLLAMEGYGNAPLGFSLVRLLYPSWLSLGAQVILAGILWLASWLWLFWGTPNALRMERGG